MRGPERPALISSCRHGRGAGGGTGARRRVAATDAEDRLGSRCSASVRTNGWSGDEEGSIGSPGGGGAARRSARWFWSPTPGACSPSSARTSLDVLAQATGVRRRCFRPVERGPDFRADPSARRRCRDRRGRSRRSAVGERPSATWCSASGPPARRSGAIVAGRHEPPSGPHPVAPDARRSMAGSAGRWIKGRLIVCAVYAKRPMGAACGSFGSLRRWRTAVLLSTLFFP